MWPQTLEMSRDECRGLLRRLELESYSHIISVFRAQGTLSEPKAKLLEELRQLFHITQERHRAEVRRAANDEQLCTIAENVCGPNTWQEWSREGRRPYPLLPRISPQTALSIVANDLAAKAYAENAKLPAPAETGANMAEAMLEQATYMALTHGKSKMQEPHVVMDEPFKVPDVPNEVKKATQKRKENDGDAKPNKKRNTQHDKQQQSQLKANNEDVHATPNDESKPSARILQQRYFYQQQQKHKQRMANKKPASALHNSSSGGSVAKRTAAPAKSGRRAQKQLQKQQQKVLLPAPPAPAAAQEAHAMANHQHTYHEVQPHVEYILDEALKSVTAAPTPTPNYAKGKHISGSSTTRVYGPEPTTPRAFAPTPIVLKDKLPAAGQQQQQLITPVKKYIVEERAAATPVSNSSISTANLPLAPQIISVQQIPAPPLAAKLRAGTTGSTSTTILPLGNKLTPKKINLIDLDGNTAPSKLKTPTTAVRLLPYEQPSAAALSNLKLDKQTPVQKYIVEERPPNPTIATLSPTGSITPLSSASTVNIIKNIPASSLNNTLITPLVAPSGQTNSTSPAAGSVFRKAPANINIKAAGNAPQLLGNIKLSSTTGSTQQTLNIKQLPSMALRNFKICSPNGKVFLQPGKLPAGSIIHKLNNANSSSSGVGSTSPTGATPTSPLPGQQRITIQKMQILTPTQVISNAAGGTSSSASTSVVTSASKMKPTTLTFATATGGKNNLVFLPASATSNMRTVTLATKSGASLGKASAELLTAKPNVLVIGSTTTASGVNANAAAMPAKAKTHQLITEDTPIDIINMPIIVGDNNGAQTDTKVRAKPTAPAQHMMVLNATDWEMELDQASKTLAKAGTAKSSIGQDGEDVIVDCGNTGEPLLLEQPSDEQLNNRIIELEDESNAIEYVDMDLEQPIEIQSTSNLAPELIATTTATTSLKTAIVSAQLYDAKLEQQLAAATATTTTPMPTQP